MICQYATIWIMTPFQQRQLALMRQMELQLASNTSATTIVPMQSDFINDQQIALTCISYIPKDIANTIQTQLIESLKTIEPNFYYYPIESMHVTIQNVRVIHNPPRFTASDIAKTNRMLSEIVPASNPFLFEYSGLLSMPTSVSVIALVTPEFDQFVKQLRNQLVGIGVPDDKTYFTDEIIFANTTICRYTHKPSLEFIKKLDQLNNTYIGKFLANDVSLVEINAGAYPSKTTIHGTYRFRQI